MVMPKLAKASTKICVGASEPKSTRVPAQSKMTACSGDRSAAAVETVVWFMVLFD